MEIPQGNSIARLKDFQSQGLSLRHAQGRPFISHPFDKLRAGISSLTSSGSLHLDETTFFSFSYPANGIERPWEFDPLENKYWPRRHYTEQRLHAPDTPRDVKIVWEINRFKDLPAIAQAALITHEKKYAEEIERRIISWIDENPFASTINWASALEISIRLISWTASLILLRDAGFAIHANQKIARSIFEQASYLAGDLSIDRIVPTNHLIGEAAGLFVASMLWDFDGAKTFSKIARDILEREIIHQTTPDGVTREASSWYHQFVTHFFDLADRVASRSGVPMSESYLDRLAKMKTYLSAVTISGDVIRYGDCDDGWAIYFESEIDEWKTHIFGPAASRPAFEHGYFPEAEHAAFHLDESFCFIRAGSFGMGGSGFSSHAHDDFLSPIIFLNGTPVIVDPGTYVYNGDPKSRRKYRGETAHNGLVLRKGSEAVQRMNFGWHSVRPRAHIADVSFIDNQASEKPLIATYGHCTEWRDVVRYVALTKDIAIIRDEFKQQQNNPRAEWRFHLHPQWEHEMTMESGSIVFTNKHEQRIVFVFNGQFDTKQVEVYDFSPSYRVEQKALLVHLMTSVPQGAYEFRIAMESHT